MTIFSSIRLIALTCALGVLASCTSKDDLSEPPVPMGDFLLGHNIVIASEVEKGPLSREASAEEWETSLKAAMANRFGRYEGDHLFHIGVHVDAYVLAVPGIPLVASPKSIVIVSYNIWDDKTREKLTDEAVQLTVFEHSEKNTFILGSGLTNSREAQIQNLSNNAARMIQRSLLENPQWFGLPPRKAHLDDDATTGGQNN